jgi:outer membrane protein assembly factor BamD (BamD/ComL family)
MTASRLLSAGLIVAVVIVMLPAVAQAQASEFKDIVQVYADNDQGFRQLKDVRIESESLEGVTYMNRAKRSETKAVGTVRAVYYGDAPREWDQGVKDMAAREYERAISSFAGAENAFTAGILKRDWVVEHGAFQQANCLLALAATSPAKLTEALKAFEAFVAKFPKSRLLPDALIGLGTAMVMAEQPGSARKHFENVVKLAGEKKLFVSVAFRARLGMASAYAAEKDWTHAIPEYESVEKKAGDELRFAKNALAKKVLEMIRLSAAGSRGDALITRAETSNRPQDFKAARAYFDGLEGRLGASSRVRAMTKVGQAICLLREGKAREAMRKLADAKVRYFSERSQVAKALYYMAKAADKLGHSEQAVMYKKELRTQFPDSEWARRAD